MMIFKKGLSDVYGIIFNTESKNYPDKEKVCIGIKTQLNLKAKILGSICCDGVCSLNKIPND